MADQILQDIKDRLNIVDVLSGYIQLKKAGTSYKALCPFHSERTPSLNVSLQKQIWHCFGCGEGGDIFGFVMRYENVDFKEALKILAQKAGVELPKFRPQDPKEQEEKELFLRINDFAARVYHQALFKDDKALAYLKGRGLSLETIKHWQIGYAPEDFHFLHHALLKKNIKEEQAVKAGVLARGEKNNIYPHTQQGSGVWVYDRFRGRITFPIFNYFGDIVGFSARILPSLDDGKMGKYINSPETAIYNKSQVLFGLNFAKDEIRKQNACIIVEGQMDCIASHQAGVNNIVASSGTALTLEQVNILRKLGVKLLIFCFDNDPAGILAVQKAIETVRNMENLTAEIVKKSGKDSISAIPFQKKIVILSEAKDADELIKKDSELWKKYVKDAVDISDYVTNKILEAFDGSLQSKKTVRDEILAYFKFVSDPLEVDHYLKIVSQRINYSEKDLRSELEELRKNLKVKNYVSSTFVAETKVGGINPLEKEVLGGLLLSPEFLEKVRDSLEVEDFEDVGIRQIILKLKADGQIEQQARESALAKEAVFMVELAGEEQDKELILKKLLKSYNLLKVGSLKKKQKVLQNEMAQAEKSGDAKKASELKEGFAQISKLKMEWERK